MASGAGLFGGAAGAAGAGAAGTAGGAAAGGGLWGLLTRPLPANWLTGGMASLASRIPGVNGVGALGAGLLGGSVLASPAIFGGAMMRAIWGEQTDQANQTGRGLETTDLSPYIDRMAAIRKAHPKDYESRPDYQAVHDQYRQMGGAAQRAREEVGAPGDAPPFVKAMMQDTGKRIGLECGEAITHYLNKTGVKGTATSLDTAKNAVRPNAKGEYPEGTIFRVGRRFQGETDGENKYLHGHYGQLHYGPKGPVWVEANYGIKKGVTANRPFDLKNDVREATWGGRVHAYLPPGIPRIYPSGSANTGRPGADPLTQDQIDDRADLAKRLYEATHNEFQNRKHEAYQTYLDDKSTDPVKAKALLLATLKQIDKDEADEQKKHHQETEKQQQEHLARLQEKQKRYWDAMAAAQKAAQQRAAAATDARSQIAGHIAALKDPDGYSYDMERGAAHSKYDARLSALGGGKTLGPYSVQQTKDFAAAKQELDASLDDITRRQGEKAKEQSEQDASEVAGFQKQAITEQAELNRELWQHAGADMTAYFDSLRAEADAALAEVKAKYGPDSKNPNSAAVSAAQGVHDARYQVISQQQVDDTKAAQGKIDEAQAASVRFEFQQHLISLQQYENFCVRNWHLPHSTRRPRTREMGSCRRAGCSSRANSTPLSVTRRPSRAPRP